MTNIQWKSFIEAYNTPGYDFDLRKGVKLVPGDTYSFYSLNDSEGPEGRKFQKITGIFSRLSDEKDGEAIFVDCVDENNKSVGERIGFMRFKPEKNRLIFSSTIQPVNENEKRTELTTTNSNILTRFDSSRPYGGTKKRRRGRKRRTVRRRGKSKRRRH